MKFQIVISILIFTAGFLGCARSFNPDVERGAGYEYRPGHPEVRLSAVGYLDQENNSFIDIAADIVYRSIFYKRSGNMRKSDITVELLIKEAKREENIVAKRFAFDQTVSPNLATSQRVFTHNRQIAAVPGEYEVQLTVIDNNTNRRTTRTSRVHIPDPTSKQTSLTNIRLMGKQIGKRDDDWFPITTYDVPGKIDSLKFVFRVVNKSESLFTINAELIQFEADTMPAIPMYAGNPSPSDIAYKGIDYDNAERMEASSRKLTQKGGVTIEFKYGIFGRGNYRFEINAEGATGKEYFKGRDFGIKSTNYPALISARELARPLIYIMDDREYEDLLSIHDSDSLKQTIDRFWLKTIGNRSDAKSILRLYYERVEEANKRFSNFKEGWKTDRGMIYILFGVPWFINEIRQKLKWSYTYNLHDSSYNFEFDQARTQSEYFPFEHYRLQRKFSYYQRQYYQTQIWKTGAILVRKL